MGRPEGECGPVDLVEELAVAVLLHRAPEAKPFEAPKPIRLARVGLESHVLPTTAHRLDQAARVRKLQAAEEHEHDSRVLPCDEVGILKAVHGLEPHAELVDIPSQPAKERCCGEPLVWRMSVRRRGEALVMHSPAVDFCVDGIKQVPSDPMFFSDAK